MIEGAYKYSIEWQYARDRAHQHQDSDRRTFLGNFRRMLLAGNILEFEVL